MSEYTKRMLDAVELERALEEQTHRDLQIKHTVQKRVALGLAWYPVQLEKKYYTSGERVEVVIKYANFASNHHKFKMGVGVNFFVTISGQRQDFKGTVSMIRGADMKVIINDSFTDIDDVPDRGQFGVELIYDEKPYRVMREAINTLLDQTQLPANELLIGLESGSKFEQSTLASDRPPIAIADYLNDSQKETIKQIINAELVGVIQGPPGTGKTTTVVELVKCLSRFEKRILVCAPSNNAVDLLASRIYQRDVNVVRIGNMSKIDDDNIAFTLDELVRNHADWSHIKKVKIEADKLDNEARKYKRTFGAEDRQERRIVKKEAYELRKWARVLEQKLNAYILGEAKVIAATLIGAAQLHSEGLLFDTVIIDEASQALDPECWNVILLAKRVILVGDHKQLPPTIKSMEARALGLESTLLERLINNIKHSYLLDTQYRMNAKIVAWPNQQFYHGKLATHGTNEDILLAHLAPILFIDTAGTGFEEKHHPENQSYYNDGEYSIIKEFVARHSETLLGSEIGIISPYVQQVRYLRSCVCDDRDTFANLDVDIDTIDGFQGQEKDLIIISLVRSNERGIVGFLADQRRLNVAITRAKRCLVIIGDSATLGQHPAYSSLIDHYEQNGAYSSAWEYLY